MYLQLHLEWLVLDGGVEVLEHCCVEVASIVEISKVLDEVVRTHLAPDILRETHNNMINCVSSKVS